MAPPLVRRWVVVTHGPLLALSALQFFTGLSNVVLGWPLVAAVLHTGGAAALVMALTWALSLSSSPVASPTSIDSRPVA